ncbi:MAG: hypothetical protein IJY58_05290 [Alphaproteobacteria bacterium]|nr:hypothetical protein [Alphaproteobacteria bacterium]MBQ9090442.1 hypothetical protein [Alphaproteobacteria bacterium]
MTKSIQKEFLLFQEFKKNYVFHQKEIKNVDGRFFCDCFPLEDEENNTNSLSDTWINAGYKLKNPLSKALSNLFPYEFDFRGQHLHSIESFFQGIKFPDAQTQKYVFSYSGLVAVHVQIASDYDWKKTGDVYWQGQQINRNSAEYDDLVDEVYISAFQNPLYRQVLEKVDRYVLHSIGKESKAETVFTRYEFEKELNCLVAFLKQIK